VLVCTDHPQARASKMRVARLGLASGACRIENRKAERNTCTCIVLTNGKPGMKKTAELRAVKRSERMPPGGVAKNRTRGAGEAGAARKATPHPRLMAHATCPQPRASFGQLPVIAAPATRRARPLRLPDRGAAGRAAHGTLDERLAPARVVPSSVLKK
jgi:hypothetical protein